MSDTAKSIDELSPRKRELLEMLYNERKRQGATQTRRIPKRQNRDRFLLSSAQQRLLLIDKLEPGTPAYNIPLTRRLAGKLDVAVLERSLREIIKRHEVLRSTFSFEEGQPVGRTLPDMAFRLSVIDLADLPEAERDERARQLAYQEARSPFDLSTGPLIRATLLKLAEEDHVVLLTMHHIVSDGWSLGVFVKEMASLYGAFIKGWRSPLPDLPIQYSDYAEWQREWLQAGALEEQLDYWRKQLADAPPALELPTTKPKRSVQTSDGVTLSFKIPDSIYGALNSLSKQENVTLFMTLLAAFQTLLSRYTGREEIILGSPIANRNLPEVEPLIGFFINTLVLRSNLSGDPTFKQLLARAREDCLGAFAHQDVPFDKIVQELQPDRGRSYVPMFRAMFTVQNVPMPALQLEGLTVTPFESSYQTSMFDLTLTLNERADLAGNGETQLIADLEYNTALFDSDYIETLLDRYQRLLEAVAANPEQRISHLPFLTEEEAQKILVEWNQTRAEYPAESTFHELFQMKAEQHPDSLAVALEYSKLTYGELNKKANQLAHHLRSLGVGPEVFVGICVGQSLDLAVAMLGVLKAGGAYVPLDPAYPKARLGFILNDANVAVLLTRQEVASRLPNHPAPKVFLDSDQEAIARHSEHNPVNQTTSLNAAYVIYTSGATGNPKGVLITHNSVVNHNLAVARRYDLARDDRILQFASIGFDVAVEELFPAWLVGAMVVFQSDGGVTSSAELLKLIEKEKLTVLNLPASFWHEWVDKLSSSNKKLAAAFRLLVLGSEKVCAERFAAWQEMGGDQVRTMNAYGPTEATITATVYEPSPHNGRGHEAHLPIGRPISNTQIYILDSRMRPLPCYVPGELYIGGDGLARAYLNQPELTAERFVPNPFSAEAGRRLYKTGDLARYLPDGEIDFLGRMDFQVKIRGFRIELEEIESALNTHPAVTQSVVLARGEMSKQQLVAYVVADQQRTIKASELQSYLKRLLPDYMAPTSFMTLDAMPLMPNGKINRQLLAGMAEKAQEVTQQQQTLPALPLRRVSRDARLPVSFAQQRLWRLSQMDTGGHANNMTAALRLSGQLNVAVLEQSLNEIAHRHESLRTVFVADDGEPKQVIIPELSIHLSKVDLTIFPKDEREFKAVNLATEETQLAFDLATGPLARASLLKLQEDEHILLVVMHQIISDELSLNVFARELGVFYDAFSCGGSPSLSPLPIQYADFASWQRQWLQGETLNALLSYWKHQLGELPVLRLNTDLPRSPAQSLRGAKQPLALSKQLSDDLKALSERNGVTLFMTLMTAFKALMYRYTGQEDIVIGAHVAGRDKAELEGLIGLFANTLIIRAQLSEKSSLRDCLDRVRQVCLEAYAHQDLPFEKAVQELQPERELSRSPLFQVAMVLRTPPPSLKLSTLTMMPIEVDTLTSKFDLALEAADTQEGLVASLKYAVDLFEPATISRMAGHFQTLLENIVADIDERISYLALLSKAEHQQILFKWNDTERKYLQASCIHLLFEQQVEETPEALAVVFEQEQISYRKLNSRANQVAHYLRSLGVGPEIMVGICMERSVEMIVGILGIIKAGGAYVPLDPVYPPERLAVMLEDARVPVLLTQQRLLESIPDRDMRVLCLDSEWETIAKQSEENPVNTVTGENLVYVIYTSGSTGTPKGVMVQHGSLASYTETCRVNYEVEPGDRVLQFCSVSFDISGEEIYPCLTHGATLVLRTDSMLDSIPIFLQRCREWEISVMSLPTAYWHQITATLGKENLSLPPSLRLVIIAGERALPERLSLWQKYAAGRTRLIHTYGPTEATISVTMCDVSGFEVREGVTRELPIGYAIPDAKIYILGSNLQPVPVGAQGEVYIGGSLLARGYHRRADTTAEKFIPNPFARKPGERIYRSGDLARYLPEGNLEFLGRVDQQVKIRGFRIELEEIETTLRQHRAVREAVILAHEYTAGNKRLIGFVVPDRDYAELDEGAPDNDLQDKQASHWREIFNNLYRNMDPNEELGFYIKGWTSSYTDLPIASEEVREWMDQTVARVLDLRPSRVYEIGSGGSGLMLLRVAPSCEKYYATDQAERSLELIQEQLKIMGHDLPQVSYKLRSGDNFEGVEEGEFDTVLIVSVAQYFPSIDYLMRVLKQAARAVAKGGHIFLGDVRNLSLLEAFHTSVQLRKSPPRLSRQELQQRVQAQLLREKQLVVDPEFFIALKHYLPEISHAEILLMRGRNRNELSKFRYDVVLHVGCEQHISQQLDWIDWEKEGLTLARMRQLLQENSPDILAIKGVSNARVAADTKLAQMLKQANGPKTVAELREEYARSAQEGIDPEDVWAIGDQQAYAVNVSWPESRTDGRYDVVFQRRSANPGGAKVKAVAPSSSENISLRPWSKYATAPLHGAQVEKLGPVLRRYLEERLPQYMVPSTFVLLDELPLTPNGKVDHKALPLPERRSAEMEAAYMAPRTELEKTISSIWQEVLEVEKVGIDDNFFDLGGHSLFMAEIFAKLQGVIDKSFTMVELFEHPTVSALASYLSRDRSERNSFQQSQKAMQKSKDGKNRLKQQFRQRQQAGRKR